MQRVPSCGYCFKPYSFKGSGRPVGPRIPRLLKCGHTFCDGCVSKLSELNPGELPCPTCEQKTPLPGGKRQVKDLPTNLYILGILINNVRAALEKDFTKGELSDCNLEEGFNFKFPSDTASNTGLDVEESICEECCCNVATIECRKCEVLFCKTCFDNVHSSSRTLRLHEEVPYTSARNPDNVCASHGVKELEFLDKTDDKLVCALCIVSASCKGHDIVPIGEICNTFKEKAAAEIDDVKKVHRVLQQSRARLTSLCPKVKSDCGEMIQQIKEHFEDVHTRIQAREVCLIQEVKAAYCDEDVLGVKDTVKELVEKDKVVEKLIQKATNPSPSFIIKEGDSFLEKLAEVKGMSCVLALNSLDNAVKVCYEPELLQDIENYGNVVLENNGLQLKMLSEGDTEDLLDNIVTCEISEDPEQETPISPKFGGTIMTLAMKPNLVFVTHIKNPCDFMIQHTADGQRLENVMEAINKYCDNARGLTDMVKSTEIGDMVCAQFSKDRYWYRARIIGDQMQPDPSKRHAEPMPKVEVCFIDYGNTEVVPLNRLRKIKPEFTDIPELALNCSLVDIVPPLQNKTWPSQSIKAFGSLTREKSLLMCVIKKIAGRLYVDLKSPEEEPTQDDDKPASVRDALVFLDVARFNSPASSANAKTLFPVRSYKKVVVPDEGAVVEVVATYVDDPDNVYVMVDSGKEYADTMKIVNQMSSMYSNKKGNQWNIPWPYKGLVCAGRFSGDQVWYRALVTHVSDTTVQVTYVDFGNSEELPYSEIRRVPDHMVQLPMQALRCSLAAIKPINKEEGWSDECSAYLSDLCGLNRFRMKVIESEEGKAISVALYEIDHPKPCTINQLLVDSMHAILTSPADLEVLPSELSIDGDDMSSIGGDSVELKDWSLCAPEMSDEFTASSRSGQQKQVLLQQTLRYKPVEYPTKTKFHFSATFVDEDCTIFGYQPENYDHSLPELMKLVQKVCADESASQVTHYQLSINLACCAKFSEDNLWYRAEVVGFPSNSTVLVDYVDFGNREEIPLTSLKLVPAFLEIPKQCVAIELEGLPQPPEIQATVSKYLTGLLVGQQCLAIIEKTVDHGVLKCLKLTLPDGSNVLDVTQEIMKKSRFKPAMSRKQSGKTKQKSPKKKKDFVPNIPVKTTDDDTLLSEAYLPGKGVTFDVIVTQVDTPNIVYLQRFPPSDDIPGFADSQDPTVYIAKDHLDQLVQISERINAVDYFKGRQPVNNVWEGMLCCACYSQDDMWYRGEVTEVISETQVRVVYFDYGTSEVVHVDQLKSFPGELISLPRQAFRCSIVGLESESSSPSQVRKAVNTLIKAVAGKKLICEVAEFQTPIMVELYDRVFAEDESYQDIPFSQRMSELELIEDLDMTGEEDEAIDDGSEVESEELVENKDSVTNSPKEVCIETKNDNVVNEERQSVVQRPEGNIMPLRTQLIPPAQFCLMKDAGRVTSPKDSSEEKLQNEVD